MALLQVLFITLCFVATSLAFCLPEHPQKQFCKAEFVVRAKVLYGPISANMPNSANNYGTNPTLKYQVYKLRILATYKGRQHVQKNLIPAESFYYVNLYVPSPSNSGTVRLDPGSEYLLSGTIVAGHLFTSFCDWRQRWAAVTSEQFEGVRTQYSKGCQCLIGLSFCFTKDCLRGCDGFPDPNYECRAKFDRCEINIGGNSCSWLSRRRSGRFQQCVKISQRFFP